MTDSMLVADDWAQRMQALRAVPLAWLDFAECTSRLCLKDSGRLIADIVEHRLSGYHQYFPAQTIELRGISVPESIRERDAEVHLRVPVGELQSLIDLSPITRDVGWKPEERLSLQIDR